MKRTFLLKMMLLLCALVAGSSSVWAADFVIDKDNFSKPNSGSGYAAYDGDRGINGITITSSNVMVNSQKLQFKSNSGYLYNKTPMPGNITKITLSTSTELTIYVGTGANPSSTTVTSGSTISGNYTYFKVKGGANTPTTATITVEYSDNRTEVNLTSFSAENTTLTVGDTQATIVENDQSGWTAAYTYSSDDEDVATISNTGVITAIGKGTTKVWAELNIAGTDANYKKGSTYKRSIDITVNKPSHTAKFSVNGVIDPTNNIDVEKDEAITFPDDPSAIGGYSFVGWATGTIDGTTATAPTFVTSATMGDDDVTYYAVFAKGTTGEGDVTLTITSTTDNFPNSYGTANTFTEYILEGKTFKIQQGYVNSTKLQWRASGNSNGTGTMYNTEALSKIQSIVLTYDSSDSNKNFTVKVGSSENPTSGTIITPTNSNLEYTFDCSSSNADYFVMTNGTSAGYLTSIAITYKAETTIYFDYCTTVVLDPSDPVVEGETVTLTTTENMDGWRTFYDADQGYTADDNTTVYVASENTETKVMLAEIGSNQIPANTPVILKTTDANRQITLTQGDVPAFNGINALQASTAGQNLGTVYRLGYGSDGISFYKYTTTSAPAGIVYVPNVGGDAPSLTIEFGSGATSIEKIANSEEPTANGQYYNLNGQRVAQPTKGLYIVNGRKVIMK